MMDIHARAIHASREDNNTHYVFQRGAADFVWADTNEGMLKLLKMGYTINCQYTNGIRLETYESSDYCIAETVLLHADINPNGATGFRLTRTDTLAKDYPYSNTGTDIEIRVIRTDGKSELFVFNGVTQNDPAMRAAEYCLRTRYQMSHGEPELRCRLEEERRNTSE